MIFKLQLNFVLPKVVCSRDIFKKKKSLQFYMRISFKMNRTKKISSPQNWNRVQFYKRNPCKNYSDQKKNQIWNWVSKIPSRTVKLEVIFEKIIPPLWFWKKLGNSPICWKYKTHKKFVVHNYIYIYILLCLKYVP